MSKCCDMRGFLTFLVLRMISQKDCSGEEIRQELEKRKGHKPSPGTIYPVLKTLQDNGLITMCEDSGKEKKYKLTQAGRRELRVATGKFLMLFGDMKEEFAKI